MLNSDQAGDRAAVEDHTEELVQEAFEASKPTLIEAPPSSGKTTKAQKRAAEAENPVTYLCGRTDLYDEAQEFFESEDGVTAEVIPSPHRDCPSFKENKPGNEERLEKLYNKGYSGQKIHYSDPETAKTPCMDDGETCNYISKLSSIEEENETIDILIGHHSHAHRELYVKDRIVIFDEFNAGAFLSQYPDPESDISDSPRKIIPELLDNLDDSETDFPSEDFQDITDILINRSDPAKRDKAINWFISEGASRSAAEDSEYIKPNIDLKYDDSHLMAPFLTFSLLCMRRVGEGIEMAPHPDDDYYDTWEKADLIPSIRVVRDRNSGKMYVWRPPDLNSAEQVIGLDGTPTLKLWNLLLRPESESGFDHRKVVDRQDFIKYVRSGMNMSLVQAGNGAHPYASGRTYNPDKDRFAAIHALENQLFPLISPKQAIEQYKYEGLLSDHVEPLCKNPNDGEDIFEYSRWRACNFASLRSSNVFDKDDLGVVSGAPHPGDDIVKIWAGLCGEEASAEGKGMKKTFEPDGDKIYEHFAHHQVVQAILRFGRRDSVISEGGATVYVITQLLPDWFTIDTELEFHAQDNESNIVKQLKDRFESAQREINDFRVKDMKYEIKKEKRQKQELDGHTLDEETVRYILNYLEEQGVAIVRENHGKGGADLYRWNKETVVRKINGRKAAIADNHVYLF
jgi:TolA-binding protein